jgi:hypothetical protein
MPWWLQIEGLGRSPELGWRTVSSKQKGTVRLARNAWAAFAEGDVLEAGELRLGEEIGPSGGVAQHQRRRPRFSTMVFEPHHGVGPRGHAAGLHVGRVDGEGLLHRLLGDDGHHQVVPLGPHGVDGDVAEDAGGQQVGVRGCWS